ncbi:MAG: S41 family peptidase [Bacteroidales bacterium]
MKYLRLSMLMIPFLFSCEKLLFEEDIQSDDPFVNFDYLWNECDRKYSYFEYKNIDWDAMKHKYRPMLYEDMNDDSLFNVLGSMLRELRDDHTNLKSNFNVSFFGNYQSGPKNFDWRLLVDHYLPDHYYRTGPFSHDFLRGDSVAYVRLSSFSGSINNASLEFIMDRYKNTDGLILDIRQNGGGTISYVYKILSRFVHEKTLLYYSRIKDGPGHNDFTAPEPVYLEPSEGTRYHSDIIVLVDRGSYSSSSLTALGIRAIPGATLIGDTTGGGLGTPNGGQLPNGWTYRFSITQTLDKYGNNYEDGVPPDVHALIDWNDKTTDEVLERAINKILNNQ